MLTPEIVEFFGIGDEGRRNDLIAFINGMMGFVETSRRESWDQFCQGMCSVKVSFELAKDGLRSAQEHLQKDREEIKTLESEVSALKTEKAQHTEKLSEVKDEIKKLLSLNDTLNKAGKEYLAKIQVLEDEKKRLTASVDSAKRAVEKKDTELKAERQKYAQLQAGMREVVNDSDDGSQPMLDPEIIVPCGSEYKEIKKHNETLIAENARLDALVTALTKACDPIPEPSRPGRISADEVSKLRKTKAELAAKLEALGEEARTMAHKYSDYIAQRDQDWELRLKELKSANEHLDKEIKDLKSGFTKDSLAMIPMCNHSLEAFCMRNGMVMICPVPIRTGYLMQLYDVYTQWKTSPCDNEGTFYATIECPYSGRVTSLASSDQIYLLCRIALNLRVSMVLPLRFQYVSKGNMVDFSFHDQIAIASLCCKIYRSGVSNGVENIIVCQGAFVLSVHVLNNVVDLQIQATHNSNDSRSACLVATPFFDRWKFTDGMTD